ncbi:MAG: polysaccharide biosynthesis tyrosine autokinase [Clostridia bacterium]|nr:polysaccharide biosynthesis tyrosine autokinase [Clostridia bacterium]
MVRKELIVHKNPKSPNSEIFRTLRTNIQFMNTNKKLKTLLVTSTFPGEGKSWVASNLAVTFAQAGKKVILIDADMRKGRQYRIFDIAPKPGLSNYLSETEIDDNGNATRNAGEYVQETGVDNLYVIAAGNVPPNPSELLVSPQMLKLLEDLKEICDLVIIDGTPCELVADSIILSRIVDSCIIVTAHKVTKKDALERVIKNIRNVGGKLAGVVINKVPVAKGYGQRYYYYGNSKLNDKKTHNSRFKVDLFKSTKTKSTEMIERDITKLQQEMDNSQDTNINSIEKQENLKNLEQLSEDYSNNIRRSEESQKNDLPKNEESEKHEFLSKTNEIMQQINEYINEEKNNLK